jgi:hypothetical protein
MTTLSEHEQLVSEDTSPSLTDPLILPLRLKPERFDTSPSYLSTASTNKEQLQDHAYLQLQQAELRIKNLEAALASTQEFASTCQQDAEETKRQMKVLLKEAERDRYWNKWQREEAKRYQEKAASHRAEIVRCEQELMKSQKAFARCQSENFKLTRALILGEPMPLIMHAKTL